MATLDPQKVTILKSLRLWIGFPIGFLIPILFSAGTILLVVFLSSPKIPGIFFIAIEFSLIISGIFNSFILDLSTQKKLTRFLILFSQYSLFLLLLWAMLRTPNFNDFVHELEHAIYIFSVYFLGAFLGALLGVGNPIQKFIQNKN